MATVPDLSGNNGTTDTAVDVTNAQLTTINSSLSTLNTSINSPYPVGATPLTNSSGNVANANAVATLAAVAGKTNYVTGIALTGGGATAASIVSATLAGLISGTQTFSYGVVAGATTANNALEINFDPPIPASAANTAIVLTLPALGAGNTNAVANIRGYQI